MKTKKYYVVAKIDLEDELELDADLSPEEVEEEIKDYVFGFFDWGYKVLEDE